MCAPAGPDPVCRRHARSGGRAAGEGGGAAGDAARRGHRAAACAQPDGGGARETRRRPAFLEQPSGFRSDDDRPPRAVEIGDPFRQGVLATARATGTAEPGWLRATLAALGAGE